jgi:hypothetical protein
VITSSMVSWSPKANPICTFALRSIGLHSISSSPSMAPSHHDQHASCHHLGVYQSPFAINTQAHVISAYVSSISQNQTRDFQLSIHLLPGTNLYYTLFQIVRRFVFSRYIIFAIHLNIYYV